MNTIRATYTIGKEKKEVEFTKEEISKYGLKRVIWFHARKLKLSKYTCNVIFNTTPVINTEVVKKIHENRVFHNPLNRLVARLNIKSLTKLLDVRMACINHLQNATN